MKKIILDVDPGHDDAIAIMFAAASTELNILGITCVAGNATLNNIKQISSSNRTYVINYKGMEATKWMARYF